MMFKIIVTYIDIYNRHLFKFSYELSLMDNVKPLWIKVFLLHHTVYHTVHSSSSTLCSSQNWSGLEGLFILYGLL